MTDASEINVPVKDSNGKVIGKARVIEGRTLDIVLNPETDFAKHVIAFVREGLIEGVSLGLIMLPAQPRLLDSPKIRFIDFGFTE